MSCASELANTVSPPSESGTAQWYGAVKSSNKDRQEKQRCRDKLILILPVLGMLSAVALGLRLA